jgi:threonine/homoserine/homoserine lactone efflux protein
MLDVSGLVFAFASLVRIVIPGQDMILRTSERLQRASGAVRVALGVKLALERRA